MSEDYLFSLWCVKLAIIEQVAFQFGKKFWLSFKNFEGQTLPEVTAKRVDIYVGVFSWKRVYEKFQSFFRILHRSSAHRAFRTVSKKWLVQLQFLCSETVSWTINNTDVLLDVVQGRVSK